MKKSLLTSILVVVLFVFKANSQDWRLGLQFSYERVRSDFEGCDGCVVRGFRLNDSTRIEAVPIVKGSRGVSFGILAEKKLSKHWIFSTGLYYIPQRKISFENDLVFAGRLVEIGNIDYILKPEIEIPLHWGYSFNFFQSRLELTPTIGINLGLGKRYYLQVDSPSVRGSFYNQYEGFLQRYSPSFGINLSYKFKEDNFISIRYFSQTLLPFGNAEWEEPYFTSGVRVAYQINSSKLKSLFKKK